MPSHRPHERLRAIINDAKIVASSPESAPAVVQAIIDTLWEEITGDDDIHRLLLARGLNFEVRAALARYTPLEEPGQAKKEQLDLWPDQLRQLVSRINRERVFVPSRLEFVELKPDAITGEEAREAGQYLIGHGEDCVRRGNILLLLANFLGNAASDAA
jgi:hypothetical protein